MIDGAEAVPIFYSFRRCPFAMRARLALLAGRRVCEIREVKLSAKPAALIAASPKATVLVLVLAEGRVLDQSLDIMRWALTGTDPDRWLDGDDGALIATCDGPFKHHLDRYKYPERHDADPLRARDAALEMLDAIEARLAGGSWLHGAEPKLTDAAIMPFVRQFAGVDRAWFDGLPLPRLRAWLNAFTALPLFTRIMIRHDPWRAGDRPIRFGQA